MLLRVPLPRPYTSPHFLQPMAARVVDKLPEGDDWMYEAKLDGYRSSAMAMMMIAPSTIRPSVRSACVSTAACWSGGRGASPFAE
jgi:hypothetical protein